VNCSDWEPVQSAQAYLLALDNGCFIEGADEYEDCTRAYHVAQAHHDHCGRLTDVYLEWTKFELGFILHDFEHFFRDCIISRFYDPEAPLCPQVDCMDKEYMTEVTKTLTTVCNEDCDSSECVAAFQSVLMIHDTCEESGIPYELETALHDYEDICVAALCNSHTAEEDLDAEIDCQSQEDSKQNDEGN